MRSWTIPSRLSCSRFSSSAFSRKALPVDPRAFRQRRESGRRARRQEYMDTSMSFTPTVGLVMSTRSGCIPVAELRSHCCAAVTARHGSQHPCLVRSGRIRSNMGKTPNSIRAILRLALWYYEYFSYKLSRTGRIQTRHPISRFGACRYRRSPIQADRFVDFGGSSFFSRFPRRHGSGVFLVD